MSAAGAPKVNNAEPQSCHRFTLILSGFEEITDEISDAIYESGCDDAGLCVRGGVPYLEFDREAESLEVAVLSAIHDVRACGRSIQVLRVELPGLSTISDINLALQAEKNSRLAQLVEAIHAG